jgi:hypothetical protein
LSISSISSTLRRLVHRLQQRARFEEFLAVEEQVAELVQR